MPRKSVFTPSAALLCWPCHGPTWDRPSPSSPMVPNYGDLCQPHPEDVPMPRGTCDRCGAEIGIDRDDVAACVEIRDALRADGFTNCDLWQTGGMCVGVGLLWGEDDAHYLATSEGDGTYYVSYYLSTEASYPDDDDTYECDSVAALVAWVKSHAGT